MPVYVYKNLRTGELFEATQSMKDPAYTVNPLTGEPVKRIIQPVGIAFKGSGFYVNDSRSRSNGTSTGAASNKGHGDNGHADKGHGDKGHGDNGHGDKGHGDSSASSGAGDSGPSPAAKSPTGSGQAAGEKSGAATTAKSAAGSAD